jgi:hypothetical protein
MALDRPLRHQIPQHLPLSKNPDPFWPTVPQLHHLKPHPFTYQDIFGFIYPNHTPVAHHYSGASHSLAYALTQTGARKLLYELASRHLTKKDWFYVRGRESLLINDQMSDWRCFKISAHSVARDNRFRILSFLNTYSTLCEDKVMRLCEETTLKYYQSLLRYYTTSLIHQVCEFIRPVLYTSTCWITFNQLYTLPVPRNFCFFTSFFSH